MNVVRAVREHGPVELAEIDAEIVEMRARTQRLLARRAILEQLVNLVQDCTDDGIETPSQHSVGDN